MLNKKLASYAAKSKYSKGRKFKEFSKDNRFAFERDRDRIIHCEAFRRLEYKTQVFIIHTGDYYRTRLTHSLEVAQVSRGIARRLHLNEDLCEAISLAHDLGHTPFGHNGEDVLNNLMQNEGGFEHNLQSYRIVTFLEKRYPDFDGLNLTFETLEGLVKHSSKYDKPMNMDLSEFELNKTPTLEAQLIDLADEIAYNNHDIDDGLKSGLIDFYHLYENVKLWKEVIDKVKKVYKNFNLDKSVLIHRGVSFLISKLIDDLVKNTKKNLKNYQIKSLDDVRNLDKKLVCFSEEIYKKNEELKSYLYENLYTHNKVTIMKIKGEKCIKTLFDAYLNYPKLLPKNFYKNIEKFGLKRVIADYIAGMTDSFALEQYEKIK